MARWRAVQTAVWDNDWFLNLKPNAQRFWLFLCTNRYTEPSGLYCMNPAIPGVILSLKKPTIEQLRAEFSTAQRAFFRESWVLLPTYIEQQPGLNQKIWISILRQVAKAPPTLLSIWLDFNARMVKKGTGETLSAELETLYQMLPIGFQTNSAETEIETETEIEIETKDLAPDDKVVYARIPDDLKGLELYETDPKLCLAWAAFKRASIAAYAGVDFMAEVRSAHAWEVANPKRRKVQRTRFLRSWIQRAQDKPREGEDYGFT